MLQLEKIDTILGCLCKNNDVGAWVESGNSNASRRFGALIRIAAPRSLELLLTKQAHYVRCIHAKIGQSH